MSGTGAETRPGAGRYGERASPISRVELPPGNVAIDLIYPHRGLEITLALLAGSGATHSDVVVREANQCAVLLCEEM